MFRNEQSGIDIALQLQERTMKTFNDHRMFQPRGVGEKGTFPYNFSRPLGPLQLTDSSKQIREYLSRMRKPQSLSRFDLWLISRSESYLDSVQSPIQPKPNKKLRSEFNLSWIGIEFSFKSD